VRDFKSYDSGILELAPLTLLIGANASGKSNLLEAMRLTAWLARGQRLDKLLAVAEDDAAVRGGATDLARRGHDRFALRCVFDPTSDGYNQYEVEINVAGPELHIQAEEIRAVGTGGTAVPLYTIDGPAHGLQHDVQVAYNNFKRGRNKPHVTCTDQQLVLTQLTTPAGLDRDHEKAREVLPTVARGLADLLSQFIVLDPAPRRMRGYVQRSSAELDPDGANLSGVLRYLFHEPKGKERVLEFVRDLPEKDINGISFVRTPRRELMVRLAETFGTGPVWCDAPLLSDGTLRVLAVATAALSAPEGSLVVVEEIDNGVHPSRAHLLMQRLREVAVSRRLSIVITTHNPALLDAVPDDLIGAVTCCYRDPGTGCSRLMRLADLEQYPELIAEGPLGYLMTRGRIEAYVHDQRSPEERRERAMAWLQKIRGAKG
jgi:predicted ATPase